jgi:phospho-N-acetylmuramoyl-pentapeptide-transferase
MLQKLCSELGLFGGVFDSVTFRAAAAGLMAFLLCIFFGPKIIAALRRRKIQEAVGKKDSVFLIKHHECKKNTPTMGGVILLGSALAAAFLWCRLDVVYVWLCFFAVISLGAVGFVDDWIKLNRLKTKGLTIWQKLALQFFIGLLLGTALSFWGEPNQKTQVIASFFSPAGLELGFFYAFWAMLVVVGTSNAVNLTDGLDGLATLCTLTVVVALGVLAYFSGHAEIARYLHVPKVPGAEELAVFLAALAGGCLGFLWYNAHPAEVFMGDTGSLPLGGIIGFMALAIKQELLLVLIGGVFVAEALSVLIQIFSFQCFGKRVFSIAPLHHAFEMKGWSEAKIVTRLFIISALLAVCGIAALRIPGGDEGKGSTPQAMQIKGK